MCRNRFPLVLLCFALILVTSDPLPAEQSPTQNESVDFNRDIRPILFGRCATCHGPDEQERAAGLRLDTPEGAFEDLGGYAAIVPGDAEDSEIMLRITTDDEDMRMPPPGNGDPLTDREIELLTKWIDQGAAYAKHWSYELPRRAELPEVNDAFWPNNEIDHFVLAKLEDAGMQPSPEADRLALARRVALDLTGLPPTWDEAQAFVKDPREDAYERYVDSMLGKPAFGERWARVWLDLARYADSAGYADDPPRTIWAYRDYVIKSLNENKPFDQFTVEQIAGDLLPDPTDEQLVATAFHRNTLTNNEGGTNDEEFRNVAVVDRVNTTMAVWMGTTMACAQCHTHKYDPITQEEYFRFFAFFNNTVDSDKRDERPTIALWSDAQKRRKAEITERMGALRTEIAAPSEQIAEQRSQWLDKLSTPPNWDVPKATAEAASRTFEVDADGWIHATGEKAAQDSYQVEIPTDGTRWTGVRLETSADQSSNFVISRVQATWVPETPTPTEARYARVELPGNSRILHLAEIEVFEGSKNIATEGKASQSSAYNNTPASRVNDGNTNGDFNAKSVQHTATENHPWVEIDLGKVRPVDRLVIWNRTDGGKNIRERLKGFRVKLLDEERQTVWQQTPERVGAAKYELSVSGARPIEFARAFADFEQSGFAAEMVLSTKADPATGWAVSPKTGQPHQLTLTLRSPLPEQAGTLRLSIEQRSQYERHLLDHFRVALTSDATVTEWAKLPAKIHSIVRREASSWTEEERAVIEQYYRSIAPALKQQRDELSGLEKELASMKPYTTVPVLQQLPKEKRRETKVQIRGNYQSTGDTVSEGTPEVFHPLDHADEPTRLDLARWLIDRENPLTARVIANRHWEQLFGTGIVETSEEFGSQGELPSHPKLLDWLAVELMDSDWDLKHLIKLMVMSATYRQSSVTTPEQIAADPGNRMLSRGPRFRISAEMIRDQALFVSGLLSEKKFGPPVKPPQPQLGLKAAFGSGTDWKTSPGDDRYRRGIYTTWRRSSPYPSMAQFDAPNREVCTVRRIRTNTPLQALVTMNDPVYVEAAQALARRMIEQAESTDERLEFAFKRCLTRVPTEAEYDRLSQLIDAATKNYAAAPEAAVTMATDPIGKLPEDADPVEYATWTVVANVILNLDEMLMKR
jgi:mono/diheme cytochrome c family protein